MMANSQNLLAEYATNGSEAAFRELVGRYLDLVYSTAFRLVDGDAHRAQDVAQTVFVDLARRARMLSKGVMLGGWLHRHTCFVAATLLRGERRRQHRERQAMELKALNEQPEPGLAHLAPVLDEAINQLGAEDRAAILLRFFEQRDLRSVGEALGSSENAAQKRVSRALDELRVLLKHRGVALSGAALGTVLVSEAVTAAPAGLAMGIAGTALASAAAGGGATLSLLKYMTMTKLKLGLVSAIALASLAAPVAIQQHSLSTLRDENQSLRQQQTQAATLAAENERLSKLVAQANSSPALASEDSHELLRLRGEVAGLRRQTSELARLQEENRQLRTRPATSPNQSSGARQPPAPQEVQALNACLNNLRQIDGAIQQCALENKLSATSHVTAEQLLPYFRDNKLPLCPSGGTYTFGSVVGIPTCSVPGHELPTN